MGIKKLNQMESAQKIMQVGVDAICMHTNFGGFGFSSFGDITTFKFGQKVHGSEKMNEIESAQKLCASRG